MPHYNETEELAKRFDAEYPPELSERLEWWRKKLGFDRSRLLRMIGMSEQQAGKSKNKDLKTVLESPQWEENAQVVEGGLHRLLSLFQYDLRALTERIHEPVGTEKARSRVSIYTPTGNSSDLLINRMAEGGPQLLSDLLTYLAGPNSDTGRAKS